MTIRVKPRHKYGAKPTMVDGIRFASKKESRRYQELKLLEKAGELWDLELQPKFDLLVPSTTGTVVGASKALVRQAETGSGLIRIGRYTADFAYYDRRDGRVIEDVKSRATATEAYRLRKKHVEAQYGVSIREV